MNPEKDPKIPVPMRLPSSLVQRIRSDAKGCGRSIDDVGKLIVEDFFSAWTDEERAAFYDRLPKKIFGAPQHNRNARRSR